MNTTSAASCSSRRTTSCWSSGRAAASRAASCDTARFEAFSVPPARRSSSTGTTLHYAPCSARAGEGFRALIALLRFTNFPLAAGGDPSLAAVNKWVLAHPDSPEAKQGAHIGLSGEIVDIAPLIA